jgi:arylsulfatase A-like enzyme
MSRAAPVSRRRRLAPTATLLTLTRLAAAGLALLGFGCSREPRADSEVSGASPLVENLVIVDIDTLRADHLGAYGYDRATSPRVDALASESILYTWAFSQAPNTPPSQASILTGLYPSTHGFMGEPDRLSPAVTTLAEALRSHGYRTAGFVDNGYLRGIFGFDQGFDSYDDAGGGLATIGPKVFEWLDRSPPEPFFLFVHTYDVHAPYAPIEPYRSRFLALLEEPPSPGFTASAEQLQLVRRACWTGAEGCDLPRRDIEFAKALYDGEIAYVDEWIGRFVDRLRADTLLERTVLVLISDHGEEFQEHGSVLHEKIYTPVTRVPLLLRLPLAESAGIRVDSPVETIDLMPTLLDRLGAPVPAGVEGKLLPQRPEQARRPIAFSESPFFGRQLAVMRGGYRLHWTRESGSIELFHLPTDPLELRDLTSEASERIAPMRILLERWESRARPNFERGHRIDLDPETEAQLRALGYLN